MMFVVIAIPFFLCWGSFLNVVAYRLIHSVSLLSPRSYCIHCRHTLAWYDLIPVMSWFMLQGKCRYCKKSISFLYPLIEILTTITLSLMIVFVPISYIFSYFLFFSALLVTIASDLRNMLISRYVSLFLVPLGFTLSALGLLPISFFESVSGAILGYALLYGIGALFFLVTKVEGMGQGDIDLLAFIGSFVGPFGCWMTLLIGSLVGSLVGISYSLIARPAKYFKIPFGPFLALGAILFVLFKDRFSLLYF